MFIILLTYTKPLDEVDRHLTAHKAWVKQGFEEGVLILSGGQRPRTGGALLALGDNRSAIQARVDQDPFILAGVATAMVIEVVPSTLHDRLDWLKL
ncbi:hypothetical protein AC629_02495 [Bradyrhizobium sp. NAS80.1]|uniref:YciI family protein n=1 Tax=Bradyrhizobium sp. NAS80.1 TaxID=1680159 RepID=UPI000963E16F|nr:YciI family protein [Bradyrhizobium sp. NAS80.1]OKO91489.1 hypothetical protein AC629_02495 [Bradyrhizobium sp. NAS80.1]